MNNKLMEIYSAKWDSYVSSINDIINDENLETKPANPLLLYLRDEQAYQDAEIRLMIFGQKQIIGTMNDKLLLKKFRIYMMVFSMMVNVGLTEDSFGTEQIVS